ncbi:hypothetical protein [Oxynema aestuarii]|uniref:Uncharacterized protein n=1 Tax=Oxynema aestuarii AP17 TaxID=2064643 RepID=A0A6H1TWZ0_9CYAN|nr:hypothetical protein [Oxynema aestuarii]QIZ70667.1 hypothetical protein HCG48_08810 [Oxynema aestuarii AP17]
MIVSWFSKDSSDGDQKITPEDKRRIVAQFKEWLPRILAVPEVQEMMTFDRVISYFQSDRPSNSAVKNGVIIRQPHAEGQVLGQIFLDRYNQIVCRQDGSPYGRQIVAKTLDPKLSNAFGDRDFVFVQLKEKNLPGDRIEQDVFSQFGDLLRDLLRLPEVIPEITYDDAIKYFVSDRPRNSRIKKGAILRKAHFQGYHIVQMFLDKNNELVCDSLGKPYGRQFVARKLDEELQECFGDKDLIIVE